MKTLTVAANEHDTLRIRYGLHKIGTQPPYFSVTADLIVKGRWEAGGCLHDEILAAAPQFADLIALHLSDMEGRPMYPYANAHYWLIGAIPSMHHTRRYHGANHNDTIGTPEQSTAMLAKHLRIELIDAQQLAVAAAALFETTTDREAVGDMLSVYTEAQRPRWKQEAQAAIAAHGLETEA